MIRVLTYSIGGQIIAPQYPVWVIVIHWIDYSILTMNCKFGLPLNSAQLDSSNLFQKCDDYIISYITNNSICMLRLLSVYCTVSCYQVITL